MIEKIKEIWITCRICGDEVRVPETQSICWECYEENMLGNETEET